MDFRKLEERQQDALRELSNIGMGHAATALSTLVGRTILLRVPTISIADLSEVPDLLGGAELLVVGVILGLEGDARGNMLLVLPQESAERLLQVLLGPENADLESALGESTLQEIGNILGSSYLNALGDMLKLKLYPSIPLLAFDMAGAVVDQVLGELGGYGDLALVLETDFASTDQQTTPIRGHFFLLPDPETLEVILQAAGGYA
jgi:chemotaxis protein CheC